MPEPLEDRIAPATLINAHVVKYTDEITHKVVTINSSKAIFSSVTVANTLLGFDTGTVLAATAGGAIDPTQQLLRSFNIGNLDNIAGENISITVAGGGLTQVGVISSSEALGKVVVQGDLGAIDAGTTSISGKSYTGLSSLTVMGNFGSTTNTAAPSQPGNPSSMVAASASLISQINGNVGSINIKGEFGWNAGTGQDAPQLVVAFNSAGIVGNGNVGKIAIGGDMIGGANQNDGSITTSGNIGSVSIGKNMIGGTGGDSASFQVGGKIGTFSVGDINGTGSGVATVGSASIVTGAQASAAGIGSLTVRGSILGGAGQGSAFIGEGSPGGNITVFRGGAFGPIKIAGSLVGGAGQNSAEINANAFGAITIGGTGLDASGSAVTDVHGNAVLSAIVGGSGTSSGLISSVGGISSLTVNQGGILGGTGKNSGSVVAATSPVNSAVFGKIVIHGNITGDSTAADSLTGAGQIQTSSTIGSVTVYGSLIGSSSVSSGSILSAESIGHITLKSTTTSAGSLIGGSGADSGEIQGLSISSINIAGQIAGGTAIGSASTDIGTGSGRITSSQGVGSITIGTGLIGGIGSDSGALDIGTGFAGKLTSLIIKSGGITAGTGDNSGIVNVGGTIGSINLNGGAMTTVVPSSAATNGKTSAGASAGAIVSMDNVGSISIGSLVYTDGSGTGAGTISVGGNLNSLKFTGASGGGSTDTGMVSISGSAGSISVAGDVGDAASTSDNVGSFLIGSGVKSINITGALKGGAGTDSGAIFAGLDDVGVISSLTVAGGIFGGGSSAGQGDGSGQVFGGGSITKASIGDLIGASGISSGSISSDGALGAITITGKSGNGAHGIVGGSGDNSGQLSAGSTIKSVTVAGSLTGGGGAGSGSITSHSIFAPGGDTQGDIGSISISGSVTGGTNNSTGSISSAGNIGKINIGKDVTGTGSSNTGAILAGVDPASSTGGGITTLNIGGTLRGADLSALSNATVTNTGTIQAAHIGSATIGNIIAGAIGTTNTVTGDGSVQVANDIVSLTVTGGITGVASNPVIISAVGMATPGKTDLALGKMSVGSGGVTLANILAGYDQTGTPVNGAASIGTVTDAGSWSEANLVAGVQAGVGGEFGNSNASLISTGSSVIPSIASIIIKGQVIDNNSAAGTYGLVSGTIKSASVNGQKLSFIGGQILPLDQSGDTSLHELSV